MNIATLVFDATMLRWSIQGIGYRHREREREAELQRFIGVLEKGYSKDK